MGSEAVDALTQNLSGELNWWVPPPNLITKCLNKIISEKARYVGYSDVEICAILAISLSKLCFQGFCEGSQGVAAGKRDCSWKGQ